MRPLSLWPPSQIVGPHTRPQGKLVFPLACVKVTFEMLALEFTGDPPMPPRWEKAVPHPHLTHLWGSDLRQYWGATWSQDEGPGSELALNPVYRWQDTLCEDRKTEEGRLTQSHTASSWRRCFTQSLSPTEFRLPWVHLDAGGNPQAKARSGEMARPVEACHTSMRTWLQPQSPGQTLRGVTRFDSSSWGGGKRRILEPAGWLILTIF